MIELNNVPIITLTTPNSPIYCLVIKEPKIPKIEEIKNALLLSFYP